MDHHNIILSFITCLYLCLEPNGHPKSMEEQEETKRTRCQDMSDNQLSLSCLCRPVDNIALHSRILSSMVDGIRVEDPNMSLMSSIQSSHCGTNTDYSLLPSKVLSVL